MRSGLIKILLVLFFAGCLVSGVSAQENITLTTYYPSPFGVYRVLEVNETIQYGVTADGDEPACNAGAEGMTYYNEFDGIKICDGANWSGNAGVWAKTPGETDPIHLYPSVVDRNVGIGISTPVTRLHLLSDATDTTLRLEETTNTSSIWELQSVEANPTDGFNIFGGADGALADRLSIMANGNVGIATTAPAGLFHVEGGNLIVNGSTRLGGAVAPTTVLDVTGNAAISGTTTVTGATTLQSTLAVTGASTLTGNVNTGAGLTVGNDLTVNVNAAIAGVASIGGGPVPGGVTLFVNGNIESTGFVYDASDENLKENIQPLSGLENVLQLEGVRYTWKKDGVKDIGITAQNVEKVFPEIVQTNETTGLKSVRMDRIIGPLIEAVKEQQQMIEAQQQEIQTLREEMDILKQNSF